VVVQNPTEPDRAFAFRVRSFRERDKREKRDGFAWKNREKTSVLEKRQPSIGFFFSLLSLRRTSSSPRERRREEEISISFFSNERELFFFTLSPLVFSLRFYANWSRAQIAGDGGGDMSLS